MHVPLKRSSAVAFRARVCLAAILMLGLVGSSACQPAGLKGYDVLDVPSHQLRIEEDRARKALQQAVRKPRPYARLSAIALARKAFKKAIALAKRALAIDPRHVPSLILIARAQSQLGHLGRANHRYEQAIAMDPAIRPIIAKAWSKMLLTLANRGHRQKNPDWVGTALGLLQRSLPGQAGRHRREIAKLAIAAVEAWIARDEPVKAERVVKIAVAAGAGPKQLGFARAQLATLNGKLTQARKQFTAWAAGHAQANPWTRIARFYLSRARYTDAMWALQTASARDPKRSDIAALLGRVYVAVQKPKLALAEWKRAATLVSPSKGGEILLKGANIFRQAGYRDPAIILFKQAMRTGSPSWRLIEPYATFLAQLDRWPALMTMLKKHLVRMKYDPKAVTRATELLSRSGRVSSALSLLKAARAKRQDQPDFWLKIAHLRHRRLKPTGRDEALKRYEAAHASDASAQLKAAKAWYVFHRFQDAHRAATKSAALAPRDIRPVLVLADLKLRRGDRLGWAATLRDFLKANPKHSQALLAVGKRYLRYGLKKAARRLLERAVASGPVAVKRAAHRLLIDIALNFQKKLAPGQTRGVAYGRAAHHMRAWLALAGPTARRGALQKMLKWTFGVGALTAVRLEALAALTRMNPSDAKLSWALGSLYVAQRRYPDARKAFERLVGGSTTPNAWLEKVGKLFLSRGRNQDALEFLSRLDPSKLRDGNLHRTLGQLYERRGELRRAKVHYAAFISYATQKKVRPRSQLQSFGRTMLSLRRYDLAQRAFEMAIAGTKRSMRDARLGLGQTLLAQGHTAKAQVEFERYLKTGRASRRIYDLDRVARAYQAERRWADVARLLEERLAYERSRWSSPTFRRLCQAYRQTGDRQGMKTAVELLLRRARNVPRMTVEAATQLEKAGMLEESRKLLEKALKKKPRYLTYLRRLMHNAILRRDIKAATRYAAKIAERHRRGTYGWTSAASSLTTAGLLDAAIALLSKAVKRGHRDSKLYIARGELYLKKGRTKAAHADFTQAVERATGLGPVLRRLRVIYRRANLTKLLLDLESRALAFSSGRGSQFLTLGRVLLAQGRIKEAAQAFVRYLERNERGRVEVAQAYARAGYARKALSHYSRAGGRASDKAESMLKEVARLLIANGWTQQLDAEVRRFLLSTRKPNQGFSVIAGVWQDAGYPERAIEWLRRAQSLRSTQKQARWLAELLYAAGKSRQARAAFVTFVETSRYSHRRWRRSSRVLRRAHEVLRFYLRRQAYTDAWTVLNDLDSVPVLSRWLPFARAHVLLRQQKVSDALELLATASRKVTRPVAKDLEKVLDALVAQGRLTEALYVLRLFPALSRNFGDLQLVILARARLIPQLDRAIGQHLARTGPKGALTVGRILLSENLPQRARTYLLRAIKEGKSTIRTSARRLVLALEAPPKLGVWPVPVLSPKTHRTAPLEEATETASLRFQLGQYAGALRAADRGLALDTNNRVLYRIAIQSSVLLGDHAGMWRRFERHGTGAYLRSKLYTLKRLVEGLDDAVGQIQVLERLLALDRTRESVRLELIRVASLAGLKGKVREHVRLLLKQGGGRPNTRLTLAATLLRAEAFDEARAVLDATPKAQGSLHHRRLLLELKLSLERKATAATSRLVKALIVSGKALPSLRVHAARYTESYRANPEHTLALLKPFLSHPRPRAVALYFAARAAFRLRKLVDARRHVTRYLKHYGHGRGGASSSLGLIASEAIWAGDHVGVQQVFSAMRHVGGTTDTALFALFGNAMSDRPKDAVPLSAEMLAIATKLSRRVTLSGDMNASWIASVGAEIDRVRGDISGALENYRVAYERSPGDPQLANGYAYALSRHGRDLEKALRLVRFAIQRKAELVPAYLDTEAWILYKMGRHAEARTVMNRVLRLVKMNGRSTGLSEIFYHAGMIRRANGDPRGAHLAFRRCAASTYTGLYVRRCRASLRQGGGE